MLANVFENFRNKYLKIYALDPAKCLSASGLAWKATLKKTKVKWDLLTSINMFSMVEKGIRCFAKAIYRYEHRSKKKSWQWFWKRFFQLTNNEVFGKTMKNARKKKDIKLVTRETRKNYLVSELNYHRTRLFTEYLLATEVKKTQILMNKCFYLGLSIL